MARGAFESLGEGTGVTQVTDTPESLSGLR